MKVSASFLKLLCLVVVLPAVVYVLALSRTVALYSACREVEKTPPMVTDQVLETNDKGLSCGIPCLSNGALVRDISSICCDNGVVIGNYVPSDEGHEGGVWLFSAKMELTGEFVPLLRVLECIECRTDGVRVVSARFRRVRKGKAGYTVMLELLLRQLEERV